jgi:dynein heavy chain 2
MMGAADRAGAAPDRALTLKRASAAEVEKVVAVGLKAYEREVKELGLLLFPEALRHIVAMDRVLSRPGGNLLLVGASGVGRRSLLSLACHLHGLELVSPSMVRDYSLRSFCAELKVALPKAGVTGTPTCLLLEDHMLRDTPVIEAVNSLLAAGEIPGLFEPQELEPMLAPLKEEFGQQGFKYRTLFDFFVARVQKFLHLALSMDPSSPTFLLRCESNPALYTRCTMLWMVSRHVTPHLTPHIPHIRRWRSSSTTRSTPNPSTTSAASSRGSSTPSSARSPSATTTRSTSRSSSTAARRSPTSTR